MIDFWSVDAEAVSRLGPASKHIILDVLPGLLDSVRMPKIQRLKHLLFLEMFKLRMDVIEAGGEESELSNLRSNLNVSRFLDIYDQLSRLELKSLGRTKKVHDSVSFIQGEMLPFAIRDIPFSFIQRISEEAFDFELFPEDEGKLWEADINSAVPIEWRKIAPAHRWNDSLSRLSDSDKHESSDAVAAVYEAPWVLPAQNKTDNKHGGGTRRSSIAIPARGLKMEGRRQSYKPTATTSASDAICLIPDESDDGFTISRGLLDAMRDWQHDEHQAPMMIPDQPLGDVLEDLLHSPSQPCTRVGSPIKQVVADSVGEYGSPSPKRIRSRGLVNDENIAPNDYNYQPRAELSPGKPVFNVVSEGSTALPSVIKEMHGNNISPPTAQKKAKIVRDDAPTERGKRRMSRDRDDYFELNAL